MAKTAENKTHKTTTKTVESDQFYFGENNKCIGAISLVLALISLALVIPWSIWAFTSSLWATSEAWNHEVVTWVKVNILVLFIVPFVSIFFGCVLGCFCKSASADLKQCMVLAGAIFNTLASAFKAAWGIFGATILVNVESNSTWFTFSICVMDLILLMYIIPFVWQIMFCFQTHCCPNKQQKTHAKKYANLEEMH